MNKLLPIQISYFGNESKPYSINTKLTILWVLNGYLHLKIDDADYLIDKDHLFIINSFHNYSILLSEYEALSFDVDFTKFNVSNITQINLTFSINPKHTDDIYLLKHHLSLYAKDWNNEYKHNPIRLQAIATDILYDLLTYFNTDNLECSTQDIPSTSDYLTQACHYIEHNYKLDLSLNTAAKILCITPQYLSRLFKTKFHTSFYHYLNQVRLSYAILLLQTTTLSIEKVAEESGFSNTRSLTHYMKDSWNMLPSEFRKTYASTVIHKTTFLPSDNYTKILSLYLSETHQLYPPVPIQKKYLTVPQIDLNLKSLPQNDVFCKVIWIDFAAYLMYDITKRLLKEVQTDIIFTHVSFHSLLTNALDILPREKQTNLFFNFNYLDAAFDYLESISLAPYIFFEADDYEQFNKLCHTFSMSNITHTVQVFFSHFLSHCEIRYGKSYVNQWIFSFGSINPLNDSNKTEQQNMFDFYLICYMTIKSYNTNIKIASPCTPADFLINSDYLSDFMDFCRNNNCCPDILNFNMYPISITNTNKGALPIPILDNKENLIYDKLNEIQKLTHVSYPEIKYLLVNNWNHSLGSDLLNDTMYKAVFVLKSILESITLGFSFTCYQLCDYIVHYSPDNTSFNGGFGLYTSNMLKRPVYYVWNFLETLGPTIIAKGKGYFVTKKENDYQIILYHYVHFSKSYDKHIFLDYSPSNRYSHFDSEPSLEISLTLCGDFIEYSLTETILNRNYGSVFDTWIKSGKISLESRATTDYIQSCSKPFIQTTRAFADHQTISLCRELEPLEIRFIQIRPIHS